MTARKTAFSRVFALEVDGKSNKLKRSVRKSWLRANLAALKSGDLYSGVKTLHTASVRRGGSRLHTSSRGRKAFR